MLNDWFHLDLRDHWLRLYGLAMDKRKEHEFTLILGAILYSNRRSKDQLINLHNISQLAMYDNTYPEPLASKRHFTPTSDNFVKEEILSILRNSGSAFQKGQYDFKTHRKYLEAKQTYNSEVENQVNTAVNVIFAYWPQTLEFTIEHVRRIVAGTRLSPDTVLEPLNFKFAFWHNNRKLTLFIDEVETNLKLAVGQGTLQVRNLVGSTLDHRLLYHNTGVRHDMDDSDESSLLQHWESDEAEMNQVNMAVEEAFQIFRNQRILGTEDKGAVEERNALLSLTEKFGTSLETFVQRNELSKALYKAGITLRVAPVALQRKLMTKEVIHSKCSKTKNHPNYYLVNFTGALAVLYSRIMRLNRIINYEETPNKVDMFTVELGRERASRPCENWSPLKYPEWLLLELDLDITIRPVQVRVARHMMTMKGRAVKNGVMQLNMGAGKTSVIVPMIVAALPNEEMLCRVTVLNSIFTTNQNLLTFTIGGLLNRRVYTVPCRRDLKIRKCLTQIEATYEECRSLKGVIITLPEHRLSFRLMAYNSFLLGKNSEAKKLFEIEEWLRAHVRDIVDESDEIYSVKYQLIYTTGMQLNIDGGNMRWRVCQKLFQLLRPIASTLLDKYGQNVIEFDKKVAKINSEQFTHFRILSDNCKQELYKAVADDILEGIGGILTSDDKDVIREFLVNEEISLEAHNAFLNLPSLSEEKKQQLLILSGYLRRGILFAALTKRWRVEFGVNPNPKSGKLMAVPFRAKDVAAERTEFGHPDMAIILTQLSYYYSGLTETQLRECFAVLKCTDGPESLYSGWINMLPPGKPPHESIKFYQTINLKDYDQWSKHLYPQLKKHTAVIDFWLENVVFPKESKQFPGKIVTNAWDLCHNGCVNATTGFSGTNDSSLLLPSNISQQDLLELQQTNDEVETTLQRPENTCRRTLEMGTTCKAVLQFMIKDGLRILIDAGALMLELGNEQIAQLWLDTDKSLEGVVYFTENNDLVIKARSSMTSKKNQDIPLKLSPCRERMERCAVYLDDQHTRGTDLKLPTNYKACVTVGSRMRRDKLMQACMRMRKLGKGQSVHFYLSHEVRNKILKKEASTEDDDELDDKICVKDILDWVKANSCQFEKDSLPYWAESGKNYAQKMAADEIYLKSDKSDEAGEILAAQCDDKEMFSLQEMYGTYRTKQLVVDLIPRGFSKVWQKLTTCSGISPEEMLPMDVEKEMIDAVQGPIQSRCNTHIPNVSFYHSLLDEEQEKELETEPEVIAQIERPPKESPVTPSLHPNISNFIENESKLEIKDGIIWLSKVFKNSSFSTKMHSNYWGQCYATEDFPRVIKARPKDKLDSFLRPMSFIVSSKASGDGENPRGILLVSLFEANELMPKFRTTSGINGQGAVTLHMFSGRRLEGQSTFANVRSLQLPTCSRGVILDERCLAPYLIAAGNLFYESMEEQKAFSRFLGLILRPWSESEKDAFMKKMITSTGFVKPEYKSGLGVTSQFQKDPTDMVMAILKCKHDVLRDADHTVQILDKCTYIILKDSTK